jgi:hypothetical protein
MFTIIKIANEKLFGKAIEIKANKDFIKPKTRQEIFKEVKEKVLKQVTEREINIALFDYIYGEGSYQQSLGAIEYCHKNSIDFACKDDREKVELEYPKARISFDGFNDGFFIINIPTKSIIEKLCKDFLDQTGE